MNTFTPKLSHLLVAASLVGAAPALAGDMAAANKAIWEKHFHSALSGNVDAVTSDFADDAILFTRGRTLRGKREIRPFVVEFVKALTPEAVASVKVDYEAYTDDTIFYNYTIGAWKLGGTSFVIVKDGKFLYVATVNYPAAQ